jgi:predicted  nucleic acid-binding Zn-ribbon protein
MSDHGLTPVRPRTTPLEATILDELRDLRERVAALEAERDRLKERMAKLESFSIVACRCLL